MKRVKPQESQRDYTLYCVYVLAAAVLLFTSAVRIRLLSMPLERDEGEYAYIGQLILNHVTPYTLAYTMKLPGTAAIYAAVMAVLGQSPAAIHFGLLLANLGSAVMTFLLGRRLWNVYVGAIAAASYSLLSLSPSLYGTAAHATQFVVPCVLGGTLVMLKSIDQRRPMLLFWSGVLFGVAFLVKQHALMFSAFAVVCLLLQLRRQGNTSLTARVKRLGVFSLGVMMPFGLTCLIMLRLGVFETFWFWSFTYAREYASEVPISLAWQVLACMGSMAAAPCTAFLILAGIGLVAVLSARRFRENALLMISLLVFSFLAVCPGFYFRAHYFIQMLPAIALLIGLAAYWPSSLIRKHGRSAFYQAVPILVFAAAVGCFIRQNEQLYLRAGPREACALVYHDNPFGDMAGIARYIREHTARSDRIAVLGSEPEILFYARRESATGFIYTYGLMEPQRFASKMQRQMISEIVDAEPEYVIFVSARNSWLPRPDSDMTILDWATHYTDTGYSLVGVVDMIPDDETCCVWGEDARDYVPESPRYLLVFERRAEPTSQALIPHTAP